MELSALIPIIIIGVIITMVRSAEQKKRREAKRRAEAGQQYREIGVDPPTPHEPVRPTVTAPTASSQTPRPRTAASAYVPHEGPPEPRTKLHPEHDNCSLDADYMKQTGSPAAAKTHPKHDLCSLDDASAKQTPVPAAQTNGTVLRFTPDNIVRGVLFAEIFGKPKALR